jgi:type IV secretion system protein TrbG
MIKKSTSVSGLFTLALLSAVGTAYASLEAKVPGSTGKPIVLDEPSAPSSSPTFPGQLKHLPQELLPPPARRSHLSSSPRDKVGAANHAARVEPHAQGFVNAIQQYPWADGALYQVYARPGNVTDIALQEGEKLVGPGPVAAGDTVRWMIGDTLSGTGPASRVHILVKPVRSDIATNLVIHTDRRTYHIELRANPSVYMASVSWTYPQDELIALHAQQVEAERVAPVATGMDPALLDFRYEIKGDDPDWRPLRAFDDGVRVFVEFPENIAQGELPPPFVLGAKGEVELVNYRVLGRYMIIDRLFERAELRLGGRKGQQTVRIVSYRKGRK